MKRGRFSEEKIISVLKEAKNGATVGELCRRHGISDATFYNWRSRYGWLEVLELRRLRVKADSRKSMVVPVESMAR